MKWDAEESIPAYGYGMPMTDMIITGQKPQTTPIEAKIAVDGSITDWNAIEPLAEAPNGLLSSFSAVQDNDNLYILLEGNDIGYHEVLINSDNDENTGAEFDLLSGVDYILAGESLYSHAGGEWEWTEVVDIPIVYSNKFAEASINLSLLELTEPAEIKTAVAHWGADEFLPSSDFGMLTTDLTVTGQKRRMAI